MGWHQGPFPQRDLGASGADVESSPVGTLLAAASGRRWLVAAPGMLQPVDDHTNPTAARPAAEVERDHGPLTVVPLRSPHRLAAALRQQAHELELTTAGADPALAAEVHDYAERLRARADGITP